jgi:hypothetical protein
MARDNHSLLGASENMDNQLVLGKEILKKTSNNKYEKVMW